MQVQSLQYGEDAHWCDKHDQDDDNFDKVGSHERFFDDKRRI